MGKQFTIAEYKRIKDWGWDVTANGVYFDWWLAGPDGASFCLIREPHHTDEDIDTAKRQIRNDRDVVHMSVGTFDPATAAAE